MSENLTVSKEEAKVKAAKYRLTYVNMRGWAEPIRFMFAYKGVPFEDVRVSAQELAKLNEPAGGYFVRAEPVLEFDDKAVYQYNVIIRYLGKLFNIAGNNAWEEAKCDEMIEALNDLRMVSHAVWLEQDPEKKAKLQRGLLEDSFPKYFAVWEQILKENGGSLVGGRLSYADFAVASRLELYEEAYPEAEILDNFPTLRAHQGRVLRTPGIKEWIHKRPVTDH